MLADTDAAATTRLFGQVLEAGRAALERLRSVEAEAQVRAAASAARLRETAEAFLRRADLPGGWAAALGTDARIEALVRGPSCAIRSRVGELRLCLDEDGVEVRLRPDPKCLFLHAPGEADPEAAAARLLGERLADFLRPEGPPDVPEARTVAAEASAALEDVREGRREDDPVLAACRATLERRAARRSAADESARRTAEALAEALPRVRDALAALRASMPGFAMLRGDAVLMPPAEERISVRDADGREIVCVRACDMSGAVELSVLPAFDPTPVGEAVGDSDEVEDARVALDRMGEHYGVRLSFRGQLEGALASALAMAAVRPRARRG